MLRRGAAGPGLEEAAAVHERDDREHLGAGADLEDREEVGEVIAEDIPRDGDRVLPLDDALKAEGAGLGGSKDADVESLGVVVGEVGFHFGDQPGVVGALLIEPEDGGIAGGAGAVHGELHPVADRGILGLAGAPDVPLLDGVLEEHVAGGVGDTDNAV